MFSLLSGLFSCLYFYFLSILAEGFGWSTKGQIQVYFLIFSFMKGGCLVKNLTLPEKKSFILGFWEIISKALDCHIWFECLYLPEDFGYQQSNRLLDLGWGLAMTERPVEWFRVMTLASADLQRGWKTELHHVGNHFCLKSPNKNSGYQGSGELSWLAVLSYTDVRRLKLFYSMVRGQLEVPHLLLLLTLPYVLLHLADFNPYSLAFISHNYEYNSFQWVLWVVLTNYQTWGWFCELPELIVGVCVPPSWWRTINTDLTFTFFT